MAEKIDKTGKEVKDEILIAVDSYIEGFAKVEPDSQYFNGYRAGLEAIRKHIVEVNTEFNLKEKKEPPKKEPPKEGGSGKVQYL